MNLLLVSINENYYFLYKKFIFYFKYELSKNILPIQFEKSFHKTHAQQTKDCGSCAERCAADPEIRSM